MSLTSVILKMAAPIPKVEDFQRILFVGPHPDDIEIGAGATAVKLVQEGKEVAFLICLDGRYGDGNSGEFRGDALAKLRRREAVASASLLGVRQVFFLGKPFGGAGFVSLSEKEMEKAEAVCDGGFYRKENLIHGLADMVMRFRPDLIFGPDPLSRSECHIDHLNVGEAVRQVACFAPFSGILSQYLPGRKAVEGVPVQGVAFYMTARPNRTVRTSGTLVNAQFSSISLHRSQYPEGSAELKSIFTYLKLRSLNYGLHRFSLHAEGFRMLGATHMHCLPESGE